MRVTRSLIAASIAASIATVAWSGTGITIYNDYSYARNVEVRSGISNNCFANRELGFMTLGPQQRSGVIAYGESVNVSIVCARYQINSNAWSQWYIGTCPESGVCQIDMR